MAIHTYDFSDIDEKHGATDFTVECQAESCDDVHFFKIHKAVVKGHSKYLDTIMEGGFQEAHSNYVKTQNDPALVAAMLWYMYAYETPHNINDRNWQTFVSMPYCYSAQRTASQQRDFLRGQVKIYEAADLWIMPGLQEKTRNTIRNRFDGFRDLHHGTKDHDWHKDNQVREIKRALTYLLEDKPGTQELWGLMTYLSHKNLCIDANGELCRSVPAMGLRLYVEAIRHGKVRDLWRWTCCICSDTRYICHGVRIFIKNAQDKVEIVRCRCGFRGLCSESCRAIECFAAHIKTRRGPPRNLALFCEGCLTHGGDITGTVSRLDGILGFWGAKFTIQARPCSEHGYHWREIDQESEDDDSLIYGEDGEDGEDDDDDNDNDNDNDDASEGE